MDGNATYDPLRCGALAATVGQLWLAKTDKVNKGLVPYTTVVRDYWRYCRQQEMNLSVVFCPCCWKLEGGEGFFVFGFCLCMMMNKAVKDSAQGLW